MNVKCDWEVRKAEADHYRFVPCGCPAKVCTTGPKWQLGKPRCRKHTKK